MKSIKTQLILALVLSLLVMLGFSASVYVGAKSLEHNAKSAREANDEMRDLLAFALSAHRYMNAVAQSLGQRTLVGNNERRLAAEAFETRIAALSKLEDEMPLGASLDWRELYAASSSLNAALLAADAARAEGQFLEAERIFERARQDHFNQQMLPWFSEAIESKRKEVEATEARAADQARQLRFTGNAVAAAAAALVTLVLLATLGAIAKPIRLLVEGTQAIAQGDYRHRIRYAEPNELGALAARFNEMLEVVERGREELLEQHRALGEAYELQGQFLSVVSHELRSPLHSILGYTELVLEDAPALDASARKNLGNIAAGARRLLALINDILDFSKLRARRMTARVTKFRVSEMLQLVLEDARALIGSRPIEVSFQAPSDLGEMLSDDVKLRQVLTNLLSNALKFTERGSVMLRVVEASSALLRIEVADTGIGIPKGQLSQIFEPFRQARGNGKHAVGGTGLGLAIVSRLSELLGGTVSVESEVGKGSVFRVELPRVLPSANGENSHY